jgi:hypothetical protein
MTDNAVAASIVSVPGSDRYAVRRLIGKKRPDSGEQ